MKRSPLTGIPAKSTGLSKKKTECTPPSYSRITLTAATQSFVLTPTFTVAVQHSQEYFQEIYKGNCIICIANIDPLWAQHPPMEGLASRLLLCDLKQKDINHLMKSIESNPHCSGKLWIIAVICDKGSPHTLICLSGTLLSPHSPPQHQSQQPVTESSSQQ